MKNLGINMLKRRRQNRLAFWFSGCLTVMSVLVLVVILGHVFVSGIGAIDLDFFTQIPKPVGVVGGGIGQAISGTIMMVAVGGLIAVPLALATAIFLTEYPNNRLTPVIRFCLELLAGVPSIVVGVFVWALLVRTVTGFSGLAGACALSIIMLPVIARTSEEVLRLVPGSLREGALALGAPRWRMVLEVVIPSVLPGLITGIVLSLARAAGETAPLLLTALGNSFFNYDLLQPMAAIPLQAYNYASSPYAEWQTKAWGAMLVLILAVALFSGLVRWFSRRYRHAV